MSHKRVLLWAGFACALGITLAGAFHSMLMGVIRDEYQLADSALLDWSWLPFLAGLALASSVGIALIVTRQRYPN